uniref:RNase H type-1 domain-containing protein n=1 Tax=Setaria italica TaxID=4555 RepID=K3XQF0_SETIT
MFPSKLLACSWHGHHRLAADSCTQHAGFDPNTQHPGLGFIARNHLGEVAFSGWCGDRLCSSAEEVECLAALIGINRACSVFMGPIWLELDCLTVQAFNDGTLNRSPRSIIIEEVKKC